jgi:pyruvate kinase
VPILALTSLERTARRLELTWGTNCVIVAPVDRFKMAVVAAVRAAIDQGYATEKDMIIVTAGVPFNTPGSTNILRVAPCEERLIFNGEPE